MFLSRRVSCRVVSCVNRSIPCYSDVSASYGGELRVQLFKKNESMMGGKAVVANAGIYVKNIVAHIQQHGAIAKEFTLFTKDGKSAGGSVNLKIDFIPVGGGSSSFKTMEASASAKSGLGVHNFTEDEAATKLQASFRGHMSRKQTKEMKSQTKEMKSNTAGAGNKGPGALVVGGLLLVVGAIAALSMKKSEPAPEPPGKGKRK